MHILFNFLGTTKLVGLNTLIHSRSSVWVRFCGECIKIVRTARELDEEMRIFKNELKEDESKVKEMIRTSGDDKDEAYLGNLFGNKIRAFVKQDSFVKRIENSEVKVEPPPVLTEEMLLPTKCFICDCSLISEEDCDKMGNNLDVVFILRMLLKVPSIYLEKQYKKCGPDPGNWIKLCDHCSRLARTAKKLDEDIRKMEKPLKSIQKDVIQKIRSIQADEHEDLTFEEKIGSFVKSNNYPVLLNANGAINLNDCSPQEYLVYLENPTAAKELPPVEIDKVKWTPRKSRLTEDGKFECGSCGRIYGKTKYYSEHQWKEHKIKDLPCPAEGCSEIFPSKLGNKFQRHWRMVHRQKKKKMSTRSTGRGDGPRTCEICGIEKRSKTSLNFHKKNAHNIKVKKVEKPQLCSLCGKEFSSQSSLIIHVRYVHHKRFSHSCHVCGVGMPTLFYLRKHLLIWHKEDPVSIKLVEEEGFKLLKCEVEGCRIIFIRKLDLDKHVEKWHGGGGGGVGNYKFMCEVCGKGFWKKDKLGRHEGTHKKPEERERKWKCKICGMGFFSSGNLWTHNLRVHKGVKNKSRSKKQLKLNG